MQRLAHAPFLQALGSAIIHSFWQFALLCLLYFFVTIICKLSPHQKFVSAVIAQFSGFSWFVFSCFFYFHQAQNPGFLQNILTGHALNNTFVETTGSWLTSINQLLPFLSFIYLLSLVFFFVKWANGYRHASTLRNQGLEKIHVQWKLFVQEMSMQLGIKSKVSVYLSNIISSPLTIGFLKPIILVPLASINHLSASQMEAVILHELAHIKRHDYAINLLLSLVETAMFFNPFMRLISNELKRERENCCDDWVLQYQYDPAAYAGALLAIATPEAKSRLALYASDKMLLLSRIRRIVNQQEKKRHQYKPLFLSAFTLILFAGLLFSSSPAPVISVSNSTSVNVVRNENQSFVFTAEQKAVEIKLSTKNAKRYLKSGKKEKQAMNVSNTITDRENSIATEKNNMKAVSMNFIKSLATSVNAIKATNNYAAISKVKDALPALIRQLKSNPKLAPVDLKSIENELQLVETQLDKQIEKLKNDMQTYTVINKDEADKTIPALFVIPNQFDTTEFSGKAAKTFTLNKKPLISEQPADKTIIIELPPGISDTISHQIIIDGKVLKITRI